MVTRHRRALAGGLAAVTLTVSLAAWQAPAGASGTTPGQKPGPRPTACSHPAPKDVKGDRAAERTGHAGTKVPGPGEDRQKMIKLKEEALKREKPGNPRKPDKPDRDGHCQDDRTKVDLAALSKKFGIPVDKLEAGLVAAKRAGDGEARVAAFARAAGVSRAEAALVVRAVFAGSEDGTAGRAELARAVAAKLGVSAAAVSEALERLNSAGGIDPGSALFASVARDLGVSPQRFLGALAAAKQGAKG